MLYIGPWQEMKLARLLMAQQEATRQLTTQGVTTTTSESLLARRRRRPGLHDDGVKSPTPLRTPAYSNRTCSQRTQENLSSDAEKENRAVHDKNGRTGSTLRSKESSGAECTYPSSNPRSISNRTKRQQRRSNDPSTVGVPPAKDEAEEKELSRGSARAANRKRPTNSACASHNGERRRKPSTTKVTSSHLDKINQMRRAYLSPTPSVQVNDNRQQHSEMRDEQDALDLYLMEQSKRGNDGSKLGNFSNYPATSSQPFLGTSDIHRGTTTYSGLHSPMDEDQEVLQDDGNKESKERAMDSVDQLLQWAQMLSMDGL